MLSKSQTLVYDAIVERLNKIAKERRNTVVSTQELQSIISWVESLNLKDYSENEPFFPQYQSPNYMNGRPIIQMITTTSSRYVLAPSEDSIRKAQEIKKMSDEQIIELAKKIEIQL